MLQLKEGNFWKYNDIDYEDYIFVVKSVNTQHRKIEGKDFFFTDYDSISSPVGKDESKRRLRVLDDFSVALLWQFDEFAYAKEFENVIRDPAGIFYVEDKEQKEEFRRITKNITSPYEVIGASNFSMWDYWREIKVDGVKQTELLYVEMNKENGWFQLWRGIQINQNRIQVL